jgi:protein-disulfide isomerase
VRLVFRDYPLPFHKEAAKAAEAAHCAQEQGKFWEMHDKLFANQKALAVADLTRYAHELGFEAPAFEECLGSGKHEATWRKSMTQAESYGVSSTPMLFINGRVAGGAVPFDALDETVQEELERVAATPKTAASPSQARVSSR